MAGTRDVSNKSNLGLSANCEYIFAMETMTDGDYMFALSHTTPETVKAAMIAAVEVSHDTD